MKSGNLNFVEPSGPLQALTGLLYLYLYLVQPALPVQQYPPPAAIRQDADDMQFLRSGHQVQFRARYEQTISENDCGRKAMKVEDSLKHVTP